MNITIKDLNTNQIRNLNNVEKLFIISGEYTQCDSLKNTILIIHKADHCEKFRLFANAKLINIEE